MPPDLLQAVSSASGGKLALILGAGCSVELPTGLPVSSACAQDVHRRLVLDGILQSGECADPTDLSVVADAVFAKTRLQGAVVNLLREYDLKVATPNRGYLVAAAMLSEGALSSVVTLNFDLALSHALSELGVRDVGVIESPADLPNQKLINIYYLHRNANEPNPENWVLRTPTLQYEWRSTWQPIIATRVLTAPVVVFAGLGTPVAVLVQSTKLLRDSLPSTKFYQVDQVASASSRFFRELAIASSDYIQNGWCGFMEELSERLVKEQVSRLSETATVMVSADHLHPENLGTLLARIEGLGLVRFGKLRSHWLLHDRPYCSDEPLARGLMADLLLGLGLIARVSRAVAVIMEDGLVEFHRGQRIVAVYIVVSGCGYRGRASLEAALEVRRTHYRGRAFPPHGAVVAGTSGTWSVPSTPPRDVVRGESSDDIVAELMEFPLFHVSELRAAPGGLSHMVP
ncbi:MAG: hypothetical protein ACHQZS_05285 [Candidatus Binatales bacterium]